MTLNIDSLVVQAALERNYGYISLMCSQNVLIHLNDNVPQHQKGMWRKEVNIVPITLCVQFWCAISPGAL